MGRSSAQEIVKLLLHCQKQKPSELARFRCQEAQAWLGKNPNELDFPDLTLACCWMLSCALQYGSCAVDHWPGADVQGVCHDRLNHRYRLGCLPGCSIHTEP